MVPMAASRNVCSSLSALDVMINPRASPGLSVDGLAVSPTQAGAHFLCLFWLEYSTVAFLSK